MGAVAVALELENAVDQMLEDTWAGHRAVLRHVADEEDGDAVLLRDAQETRGRLADLRHRPGRRSDLLRPERLDGVDDADAGLLPLERLAHELELRLGEDLHVVAAAQPGGAQLDLRDRLLARDEERATSRSHRAERAQEQRRLADAGLAADEDERRRHEPSAEDTVELGHAGRDSFGLLRDYVDKAKGRPPGAAEAWARRRCPRAEGASATIVPNSPQPGQRPSQRPEAVPHSVHACWTTAAFATP